MTIADLIASATLLAVVATAIATIFTALATRQMASEARFGAERKSPEIVINDVRRAERHEYVSIVALIVRNRANARLTVRRLRVDRGRTHFAFQDIGESPMNFGFNELYGRMRFGGWKDVGLKLSRVGTEGDADEIILYCQRMGWKSAKGFIVELELRWDENGDRFRRRVSADWNQ